MEYFHEKMEKTEFWLQMFNKRRELNEKETTKQQL